MKKIIGSISIFLLISCTLLAQGEDQIRNKIQANRIAFITDQLSLTPGEAQAFWPLYNSYKEKERSIRKEAGKLRKINALSDAEVEELIERQLDKEEQLVAAKRVFIKNAKQVMPIKKIAKLPRVERKFKEMMLNRAKGQYSKKS